MKKLIALCALSVIAASASAYANPNCSANKTCTYPIGTWSNDKNIRFTELQPGHIYQCYFRALEVPAPANLEVRQKKIDTPGLLIGSGYSHYLPTILYADTRGVAAGHTASFVMNFNVSDIGRVAIHRYKMALQCMLWK